MFATSITTALAKEGWNPYPAYKPSSVEWLDALPLPWGDDACLVDTGACTVQ